MAPDEDSAGGRLSLCPLTEWSMIMMHIAGRPAAHGVMNIIIGWGSQSFIRTLLKKSGF